MDQASLEVDLLPAQGDELGHPKAVPVGQQKKRPIARPLTLEWL